MRRIAVVLALAALCLSGCASIDGRAPVAPSPTPTTACPYSGTENIDLPGCALYDPDAQMRQNRAYKVRAVPTPEVQAALDAALIPASSALAAITEHPATEQQVRDALEGTGLNSVETDASDASGVAFWAEVRMDGCLLGMFSPAGAVQIDTGGFVADGGCRALSGH